MLRLCPVAGLTGGWPDLALTGGLADAGERRRAQAGGRAHAEQLAGRLSSATVSWQSLQASR